MTVTHSGAFQRGALRALRSVLLALVLAGFFGIVGAVVSYRADVHEARLQARARIERQGRLYAEALSLHFELLRAELQRLAERSFDALRARDSSVVTAIHDDEAMFSGGVALFGLDGTALWSELWSSQGGPVSREPWFQQVLGSEAVAVDAWGSGAPQLAIALPVRTNGTLAGVLVGIVRGSEWLLSSGPTDGEHFLLLGGRSQVLFPGSAPQWALEPGLRGRVDGLRAKGGVSSWEVVGFKAMAGLFPVAGTSLVVLATESEDSALSAIRTRLLLQLAFLLLLQVGSLGAFSLFLRRTWRAFLDAEFRLTEQEKLAALGTASSLIAHEVKNSLNGLNGAMSLLLAGGDTKLVSRTVRGQVDRLGHLATSLLSFSRRSEPRAVPLELDVLARGVVEGTESLPERAEVRVEVALTPGQALMSDPLLLTTAIDNLLRNAIESAVAAKDVGLVTQPVVRVEGRREGAWLILAVQDNGGGPPKGFEERLGEPFFTTKPRGIGLGLTMTLRVVEQLGGRLVFTRTAQGSLFELWLPEAQPRDGTTALR